MTQQPFVTSSMTTAPKAVLTSVLAAMLCASAVAQTVPPLINYQGRLTDPTGAPLAAGNYGIQFRLWDSATNTTGLIWGQQQNAAVSVNGVFNVMLGAPGGSPITSPTPAVNDLRFAFAASNCFLGASVVSSNGVSLGVTNEIAPRQQILSVPFAISALHGVPEGTIVAFGGDTAAIPVGWLYCDGTEYPTNQYPRLAATVRKAWGGAATTFRVPDLRGVFLRGLNSGRAGAYADPDVAGRLNAYAGGNSGANVGSYQTGETKSHTHNVSLGAITSVSSHSHYVYGDYGSGIGSAGGVTGDVALRNTDGYPGYVESTSTESHSHSVNVNGYSFATGGNESRPVNAYVKYIIKY